MQKIGMTYYGEFNFPAIAKDHPLSLHVLYQVKSIDFKK